MTPGRKAEIKKSRSMYAGYHPWQMVHRVNPTREETRRKRQIEQGRLTRANGLAA